MKARMSSKTIKSVKSQNPRLGGGQVCKSLLVRPPAGEAGQAGVIQTSYDIVKAHGGELKVESKENEGPERILQLPFELDKTVKDA